jgi:protein-L-isoaspartate O-methyltransferase
MDACQSLPEGQVYDAVMVTCGIPGPMFHWMEAMKPGGRLVAPVGTRTEHAIRKYVKVGAGLEDMGDFAYCRFLEAEVLLENGKSMSIFDVAIAG